jgi:hypothetical protein
MVTHIAIRDFPRFPFDSALSDVAPHRWPGPGGYLPLDVAETARGGLVNGEPVTSDLDLYAEETPIEGHAAVKRWLALYDRARDLRANLHPGDVVGERQARRAIRSLFLYEHQLTAPTRRKARERLWRRVRAEEALPDLATRARWSYCRCAECQQGRKRAHNE